MVEARIEGMKLQLITFNVNGLRSIKEYYAQSKLNNCPSFPEFLDSFEADIICFQEHKTNTSGKLGHDLSYPKGYSAFYAFPRIPRKIGYSGVVTFVKQDSPWLPIACYDGFSGVNDKIKVALHDSPLLKSNFSEPELLELDSEGRCIITDHFHFLLLNIYFPNDSGAERTDFREKFYRAVQLKCLDLVREHGKSLIILGDVNVAYHPFDHCQYATINKQLKNEDIEEFIINENNQEDELLKEFYSNPMRKWLADWLYNNQSESEGWRDCFRALHPFSKAEEREKYTCWNTQISGRGTNYGTRIDVIFVSGPLFMSFDAVLEECDIMPKVMGSDHCPVMARFRFPDEFKTVHLQVLKDCKLVRGNIPQLYGKLDSFFSVKKREEKIELLMEEEQEVKLVVFEQKKTKISDYFQSSTVRKDQIDFTEDTSLTIPPPSPQASFPSNTTLANLFNRAQNIPKCHHHEPCKLSKVKKAGLNRGRSFYCCARPGGAVNDPEARCEFFEWLNKSKSHKDFLK